MSLIKAVILGIFVTIFSWGLVLITFKITHPAEPEDTASEIVYLIRQAEFNQKYAELSAFWENEFKRIQEDTQKDQEYFDEVYNGR